MPSPAAAQPQHRTPDDSACISMRSCMLSKANKVVSDSASVPQAVPPWLRARSHVCAAASTPSCVTATTHMGLIPASTPDIRTEAGVVMDLWLGGGGAPSRGDGMQAGGQLVQGQTQVRLVAQDVPHQHTAQGMRHD